jgi:hypothetical protein
MFFYVISSTGGWVLAGLVVFGLGVCCSFRFSFLLVDVVIVIVIVGVL